MIIILWHRAYHKLLKNSMFLLVLEMHARLPFVPEPYYADFEDEEAFTELQHNVDLHVSWTYLHIIHKAKRFWTFWTNVQLISSSCIVWVASSLGGSGTHVWHWLLLERRRSSVLSLNRGVCQRLVHRAGGVAWRRSFVRQYALHFTIQPVHAVSAHKFITHKNNLSLCMYVRI